MSDVSKVKSLLILGKPSTSVATNFNLLIKGIAQGVYCCGEVSGIAVLVNKCNSYTSVPAGGLIDAGFNSIPSKIILPE